ncbi:MAG: 50S ribosomal protein L39e [Candidatus Undinarchaeales archaeon]|jgi:large subunit ribosomal protein L39e|nr:50S ribosomal protein L39e [Methanopyri archaeon]MDP7080355.1 50S ribosomal protein L39e [Candidatus Undinarchaeales archaeon]MDP7491574.1 50S ribosomal protein L39e [Candidatus Undinarchaeales archaeon]
MAEPHARKLRYARYARQNKRVPLWVVVKTRRRVRDHPKRHHWRISNAKI